MKKFRMLLQTKVMIILEALIFKIKAKVQQSKNNKIKLAIQHAMEI